MIDNFNNKYFLIPFSKDDINNSSKSEIIKQIKSDDFCKINDFKEFVKSQINNRIDKTVNENVLISAKDWNDLNNKIESFSKTQSTMIRITDNELTLLKQQNKEPCIVFLFSGQGAQWNSFVFELYDSEPIFKESMDLIDKKMMVYYGYSAIERLRNYKDELDPDINNDQMITQTALLMSQIAVYKLYTEHWGLKPSIVLGHSFGEVVASYASGMLPDLDTLCYIIYQRGFQQQKTFGCGKGMAWIDYGADEFLKKYSKQFPTCEIACLLSPSNIVIGDYNSELEKLIKQCELDSINTRLLSIPTAFHNSAQDILKDDILKLEFKSSPPSSPTCEHMSTVRGKLFNSDFYFTKEYMYENLRDQARLALGISSVFNHIELKDKGRNVCFIEVGPRPSLLNYVKKLSPNNDYFNSISILSSVQKDKGNEGIHETIKQCYYQGYSKLDFNKQFI